MRAWTSGILLIFACGILPAAVLAQEQGSPEARRQIGCFRGRPLPACKSFWIFEMQGTAPLMQTSRVIDYGGGGPSYPTKAFNSELEWNVGHMVNLGATYAIGGMVSGGTGGGPLTALRLRARRWLGPDLSLEVDGGLLWNEAQGSLSRGVGGTAALRFNVRDQGSFFLRWDAVPISPQSMTYYDVDGRVVGGFSDPGGTQHALSIGVAAGSVPGLILTGATGLWFAIAFALWGNYD